MMFGLKKGTCLRELKTELVFHGTPFIEKDWKTNYSYLDLDIWQVLYLQ